MGTNHLRAGRDVIKQEIKGLQALSQRIDKKFGEAVDLLNLVPTGKIIVTGVGKSGHIGRKLGSTLTSLGSPAIFLGPVGAAHGDLGIITEFDAILMLSRSGSAIELHPIGKFAIENDLPFILISENVDTSLAMMADITLKLPKVDEAWGHAPTTSTIMQLALGDALAVALAQKRCFTMDNFRVTHPGGALGEPNGKRTAAKLPARPLGR